MGTQYETITVTIGGVNPQTKTVSVPVDTSSGAGSATFSYTGTNGGSDNLQATATIAGNPYTSNTAQVNWQSSNGSIQLDANNTVCYAWGDSPHSGSVASYIWGSTGSATPRNITSSGVSSLSGSSLSFDYYTESGSYASGRGGTEQVVWANYNSAGSFSSYQYWPPYQENYNCIILTNLLVPAPGNYTMTLTYKDGSMWGIGNSTTGAVPTWSGKGTYTGNASQTATANSNFPLLYAPPMSSGSGGYVNTASTVVNFPQAGVYPLEGNWDYWYHSGRIFHITSNSTEIAPVTLISAPPPSTPSGNLTITPGGGATNLQVINQPITLTVNVSGITYPTKSYCPVYEGQSGSLTLYNDPSSPVFNFQTYNSQPVSKSAAASTVFALSSADNTAYQGLFTIGFDGTNFNLNYNGNTANPNSTSRVLSTSLIITADDIAWYNSTNNAFDLFGVSGTSGGVSFNFEVDYMNKPAVSSISPTTIQANGGNNTLAIALTKAFSPQQQGAFNTGNTLSCACTVVGAQSTGTPVAVLDSNGWLTGWNVPFVAPTATTNQTLTVSLTVNGTLTYLSGNTFVTNTVTYISSSNIGTITATGVSFTPPVAYGFSTTGGWAGASSVTLTAQIFTPGSNDPVTVYFVANITEEVTVPDFGYDYTTTYTNGGGTGALISSSPATVSGVSGYLQTYSLTTTASTVVPVSYTSGDTTTTYYATLGYTGTDKVSSLSCSYTTTGTYSTY